MINSLDRHLRRPDQHDGLAFHADCPVCRARAAGTLPAGGVVGRQTQAALAAGVLAVSAVGPSAAAAAAPRPPAAPVAPAADPTLDSDWQTPGPEGDSGSESAEQAPPAVDDGGGGGEDETGTVETEPLADVLPDVKGDEPPPEPPPSPPAAQPAPTTPPAPTPAPEQPAPPAAPAPSEPVQAPVATQPSADAPAANPGKRRGDRERVRRLAKRPSAPSAPAPVAPAQPAVDTSVSPPATTTTSASAPATPKTGVVSGDSYRVRPGDSLWSIAQRLLGPGASPGQVAREVDRLWTLNAERIATGNPDLLAIGTVLKLR